MENETEVKMVRCLDLNTGKWYTKTITPEEYEALLQVPEDVWGRKKKDKKGKA